MKKIFLSFSVLLAMLIFVSNVYAGASLSVSSSSVTVGNNVTVSYTITGAAWGVTLNSSGPVSFVSGTTSSADTSSNALDTTITLSATYKTNGVGTATFSLTGDTTSQAEVFTPVNTSKTVSIVNAPAVSTPTTPTTTTKSSNANLKKLVPSVEGLSPNFSSNNTNYSLIVPSSLTTLNITASVEDAGAKYWVSGNENIPMGNSKVTVTVTAADGTKKYYTINVTKAADVKKAVANVTGIVIDGVTLSPEFNSEVLEYTIPEVAADKEKIDVLAYTESDKAKLTIIGNDKLVDGENTIKLLVVAEDGITTKEYLIKFNKLAKVAVEEENNTEEVDIYSTNSTITDKNKNNFFNDALVVIKAYLRDYWLVIALLCFSFYELIQIIYMYKEYEKLAKKLNGNVKEEIVSNNEIDKTSINTVSNNESSGRRRGTSSIDKNISSTDNLKTENENIITENINENVEDNVDLENEIETEVESSEDKSE